MSGKLSEGISLKLNAPQICMYKFMIFKCLTIASLSLWANFSLATNFKTIEGVKLSSRCQESLSQALSRYLPVNLNQAPAVVGSYADLNLLLANRGVDKETLIKWNQILTEIKNKPHGFILKNLAQALKGLESDPSQILLCLTDKNCELEVGVASFIPIHEFNFLIFNLTENTIRHLIHELVHFADWQLLKKWVSTNYELKAKGKSTSDLYNQFVKYKNGEFLIDEDFVRIFLESRAYLAEYQISYYYFQSRISLERLRELKTKYIESFFFAIEASGSKYLMLDWNFNRENFEEFVVKLNNEINVLL
ncbi:MAG: hypothetical protein KDD58_07065 [Bdellovibrionales bacterium]|nr:hypothetical protein [Bdellovibrionales bacterium]